MDERQAYIALNQMGDVGPVGVRVLAEALGGVRELFDADQGALRSVGGVSRTVVDALLKQRGQADPGSEEDRAQRAGARLVTPADAEYPRALAAIHDPPLALYVRGKLLARDAQAIAVVGTRHASTYGMECAERLAAGLAEAGVTVVSGLARGIDTAAHRAAVQARGRTVAVLGGGLDKLYPPENASLADGIADSGAVLTEFPMGRSPDRTTFPMRNRVVSGMSRGVVVVEAGQTSGAMITARMAAEQGRTVYAVPGRVDMPGSAGPHALLRDGAALVRGPADILDEFGELFPSRPGAGGGPRQGRVSLTPDEQRVLDALDEGEADMDAILRATGMRAGEVSAALIRLEMKHCVRMLPGRRVARLAAASG